MADMVGLTPRHLGRLAHARFRQPVGRLLKRWQASRGRALLCELRCVKAAAEAAGYQRRQTFCAQFQKRFGVTPSTYLARFVT